MTRINWEKQLRKAIQLHDDLIRDGKREQAHFVVDLYLEMLEDAANGHERPWKHYLPRLEEEFASA